MEQLSFIDLYAINHPFAFYLSGSILMFMLGISIGNYATSFVFRLPRGLKIANDNPYCECDKRIYLKPRDLFPLFSWLLSRGKCRYCEGVKIPATYTMIEFLCGSLFVINWVMHGIGEKLILVLAIDAILITIASIYFLHQRYFPMLFTALVGCAGVYRTLLDGSIYGFVYGAYWATMLGLVIWQLECFISKKKLPYPDYITILALGAICVGIDDLILFIIGTFICSCIFFALKKLCANFALSAWVLGACSCVIIILALH
jgi:leader peptidase (prepilin peptidase) / N-methyltransferase